MGQGDLKRGLRAEGRGLVAAAGLLVFTACSTPPPPPAPVTAPPQAVARPRDRTTLTKDALALFDAKRYDEAVAALTEAVAAYPEIAPFLRLRIVEAELARGN